MRTDTDPATARSRRERPTNGKIFTVVENTAQI